MRGGEPRTRLLGLLVFALVASVSLSILSRLTPLGFVDGTADGREWFEIGRNVAAFGVFGYGEHPWVHRPPGYPLWVATILRVAAGPGLHGEDEVWGRGAIAVRVADSLLLGLTSLFVYFWLATRLRPLTAFTAALLLGTNAYSLVMATLIRYDMLQWAATLGSSSSSTGLSGALKSMPMVVS